MADGKRETVLAEKLDTLRTGGVDRRPRDSVVRGAGGLRRIKSFLDLSYFVQLTR